MFFRQKDDRTNSNSNSKETEKVTENNTGFAPFKKTEKEEEVDSASFTISDFMAPAEQKLFLCAGCILMTLFLFGAVSGLSQAKHQRRNGSLQSGDPSTTTTVSLHDHTGWTGGLNPFLAEVTIATYSLFERVPLKVGSLRSPEQHPNEPVQYYDLSMCIPPEGIRDMTESLGEQIFGEVVRNSAFEVRLGVEVPAPPASSLPSSQRNKREWLPRRKKKPQLPDPDPPASPPPAPQQQEEEQPQLEKEDGKLPVDKVSTELRTDTLNLCDLVYSKSEVKQFEQRVKGDYRLRFTLDELPNMLPIEMSSKDGRYRVTEYQLGMSLGRVLNKEERELFPGATVCLHSVIAFHVDIHEVAAPNSTSSHPRGAYRIVGFRSSPLECVPLLANVSHTWQYSVKWHKSSVSWGSRLDVYTRPNREISNVEYLSLFLSLGMLLLLGCAALLTMKGKAQKQLQAVVQRTVNKAKGIGQGMMRLLPRSETRTPKRGISSLYSFVSSTSATSREECDSMSIEMPAIQDPAVEEGEMEAVRLNSPLPHSHSESHGGGGGGGGSVRAASLNNFPVKGKDPEWDLEEVSDILSDTNDAELDSDTVWKVIGSSIFVPPDYSELYAALVGMGTQLLLSVAVTLLIGLVALAYETQRGLAIQVVICFYLAFGGLGGYATGIVYRSMEGSRHARVLALLVFPLPTAVFGLLALLNVILLQVGSSAAIPFWMLALLGTSWSLFGGIFSILGYGISMFCRKCSPCICVSPSTEGTASLRRAIPSDRGWAWKSHVWRTLFSTAVFSAILLPCYYLFSSVWGYLFYTAYGALLLTAFTAAVLTAVSSLCYVWIQITSAENWKWWWAAWLTAATPAAHFIAFSVVYYLWFSHIKSAASAVLYFGYVALLSLILALMLGALGVWSSLIFLTWLYRLPKRE